MIIQQNVIQVMRTVEQQDIPGSNDKRTIESFRLVPNGELLAQNDSFYVPQQMEQVILQYQKQIQDMQARLTPIAPPPAPLTPIEELTEALGKVEEANTGLKNLEIATQDARRKQSDNLEQADRAIKTIAGKLYTSQSITNQSIQASNVIKG